MLSKKPVAVAQSMTRIQLVEWVREQEVSAAYSAQL